MALPVNTFTTFDAIGNREDLSDTIYDISPMETPFVSGISRDSADSTKHEWQTDALAAATTQAFLEGDDATADAAAATTRLFNDCQIFRKVISVSGTQRAVRSAGRADEFEYQLAKRGRELKRNIEKTALGVQARTTGTNTATARTMSGVATWLSANKHHFAATSTTPGAGTAIVQGNAITVTTATQLEDPVSTVIASSWNNGGDPSIIMTGSGGKRKLSKLTGIATLFRDVPASAQGQIVGAADAYVSDFGNHTIVPNRFMPSTEIYFLDMEFWALSELRGMSTHALAKTGDSDRAMLVTELTLKAKAPDASGKIADMVFV